MADHLVDRGADRFWESLIIEWRGNRILNVHDVVVAYSI